MPAHEYKIKIQNELTVVSEEKTSKSGNVKQASENVQKQSVARANQEEGSKKNPALAIAVQLGSTAVREALANYGNLTGDYITQSYLQVGAEIAGDIFTIAKGGWVGVGIVASKRAIQVTKYLVDIRKQELSNALLSERLGIKE